MALLTSPASATYRVAGMTCEHCRTVVTAEVSRVAGVESVDVDLDTKPVRIAGAGTRPPAAAPRGRPRPARAASPAGRPASGPPRTPRGASPPPPLRRDGRGDVP